MNLTLANLSTELRRRSLSKHTRFALTKLLQSSVRAMMQLQISSFSIRQCRDNKVSCKRDDSLQRHLMTADFGEETITGDAALKAHLGDQSVIDPLHLTWVGPVATKRDPKCRFM
jgi:hypothetical protein